MRVKDFINNSTSKVKKSVSSDKYNSINTSRKAKKKNLCDDNDDAQQLSDQNNDNDDDSILQEQDDDDNKPQPQPQPQPQQNIINTTCSTTLCYWNIKMAPAVPVVKGVPVARSLFKSIFYFNKQCIQIELWTTSSTTTTLSSSTKSKSNSNSSTKTTRQVQVIGQHDNTQRIKELNDNDIIRLRIMSPTKSSSFYDDVNDNFHIYKSSKDDGSNSSDIHNDSIDHDDDDDDEIDDFLNTQHGKENYQQDSNKDSNKLDTTVTAIVAEENDEEESKMLSLCVPLDSVIIRHTYKKIIELGIGKGPETKVRIVTFNSKKQVQDFTNNLNYYRTLEKKRSQKYLDEFYNKFNEYYNNYNNQIITTNNNKIINNTNNHHHEHEEKQQSQSPNKKYDDDDKDKDNNDNYKVLSSIQASKKIEIKLEKVLDDVLGDQLPHVSPLLPSLPSSVPPDNDNKNQKKNTELSIIVEIVSAINLPDFGILNPTDPYVVCHLGQKELHRTSYISNNCNPIWTVDTGSFFLIQITASEFFTSTSTNSITFTVYDYNTARPSELIGRVNITLDELLLSHGQRTEHNLIMESKTSLLLSSSTTTTTNVVIANNNNNNNNTGIRMSGRNNKISKLILHYRPATQTDLRFIKYVKEQKTTSSSSRSSTITTTSSLIENTISRCYHLSPKKTLLPKKKWVKKHDNKQSNGDSKHVLEFRVMPGPNPKQIDETTYMTHDEIVSCSEEHSYQWVEAGSGNIGKIYIEILGCSNIPTLAGTRGVVKPNVFATIVYEDNVVHSDIIHSCNPRWVPWSRRAFLFNMLHPSSQLNLGIFDHESHLGAKRQRYIGRVSIDITNASPDTLYTVEYSLYKSDLVEERATAAKDGDPIPSVKVRIRLEYNPRAVVLASMFPSPPMFVKVRDKTDFLATYYTCNGTPSVDAFSINTVWSYIDELEEYQQEICLYVMEGLKTIILWRGHFPITFSSKRESSLKLPIHSIIAFVGATTLAENINLLPSYTCFGIAWFLLASMWEQRVHPDPWHQCIKFWDIFWMATRNRPVSEGTVEPYENEARVNLLNIENDKRAKKIKEAAKLRREKTFMLGYRSSDGVDSDLREAQEQLASVEKTNLQDFVSKLDDISINPFRDLLHPYQLMLGEKITQIRIVKSIILWKECYIAFLITCICILFGVLLLWFPLVFLVHWTSRIVSWTFLGPWMKIFDPYVRRLESLSEEERKEKIIKRLKKRYEQSLKDEQIKRENAMKRTAISSIMFGKYITPTLRHKQGRHFDYPLPTSKAEPVQESNSYEVVEKMNGQNLANHIDLFPQDPDSTKEMKLPFSRFFLGDQSSSLFVSIYRTIFK